MKDKDKTKEQLISELVGLRRRIAGLETAETERQHAEEALQESEERFRQFFNNEPEYCYMISPDGLVLDINKAALKVLGYQKEQLVGMPLRSIYAPESLSRVKQLFEEWKKTGVIRDQELTIITRYGERRTVLLSVDAIKNRYGKILHSVSVQKDITERKRMEEELRKHRDHLEEVVEERTAELRENNKQLLREIAERERAEEGIRVFSNAVAGRLTP